MMTIVRLDTMQERQAQVTDTPSDRPKMTARCGFILEGRTSFWDFSDLSKYTYFETPSTIAACAAVTCDILGECAFACEQFVGCSFAHFQSIFVQSDRDIGFINLADKFRSFVSFVLCRMKD